MKKIYFFTFTLLVSFYSHAQIAKNWIEVGIKGDVNFNYLLNTNIIDDVNMNSSYFSVGNFKGINQTVIKFILFNTSLFKNSVKSSGGNSFKTSRMKTMEFQAQVNSN